MKIIHTLIIFLIGTIIFIYGVLCKITHFYFIISANLVLFLAYFIQIIGVILFIFKLIQNSKKKKNSNS